MCQIISLIAHFSKLKKQYFFQDVWPEKKNVQEELVSVDQHRILLFSKQRVPEMYMWYKSSQQVLLAVTTVFSYPIIFTYILQKSSSVLTLHFLA